jgi:hypothetical protein
MNFSYLEKEKMAFSSFRGHPTPSNVNCIFHDLSTYSSDNARPTGNLSALAFLFWFGLVWFLLAMRPER